MDGLAIAEPLEEREVSEAMNEPVGETGASGTSLVFAPVAAKQIVGAFRVHEAAEVIPSLEGEAFEALVNEIAENGQRDVVVTDGDVLIEGVDTVRAIGVLKERGVDIDLQTVPWSPRPGQSVPEFIAYKHLQGPRFTDAQRAQIAADLLPFIEKERAAAQESARIQPGEKRNPRGINKRTAEADGGRETHPPADAKDRNKAKRERSTIGQIAKLANVTDYAAKQAVTIKRTAPQEEIAAVKAGVKKIKVVLAEIAPPTGPHKPAANTGKPVDHPFTPTTALEQDLLAGWVRLRDGKVAVPERAEARDVIRAILKAEEAAERIALESVKGGGK